MGYTTDFTGEFQINKPVNQKIYDILHGLSTTRRMKRKVAKEYGVDGEFYFQGKGDLGQDHEKNIIDYNTPPKTQPGLWCNWLIDKDRQTITWDGGEKFYSYIEWIKYIVNAILAPQGYLVNGEVGWEGEYNEDMGTIEIVDNVVTIKTAVTFYLTSKDEKFITNFVESYLNNPLKEIIEDGLNV